MNFSSSDIERLLPHKGAMCFLDSVTHWDNLSICCSAAAPSAGHPLMRSGRVAALVAIEYAAQATALHGALLEAATRPQAGMLASLRDVDLHCVWFPVDKNSLTIHAKLLSRTVGGCSYSFEVESGQQIVACGCLLVAFQASIE